MPPLTPPPSRLDVRARWGVVLLTGIAAGWRFAGLDAESLWHDEVTTYDLLTRPLGSALTDLGRDGHSPFYPLLLRASAAVVGTSPAALRGLSAVAGTLAVPLLYALAARWRGAVAGLLAASLAALSSLLVRYSQEAREYAVFFLFATASFAALDRAVREPTAARLAAWSLALALTLWSGVYGLAVLATQVLWLAGIGASALAARDRRPRLRAAGPWLAALAVAVVAYAPWLVVLGRRPPVVWLRTPGWGEVEATVTGFADTRRGLALLLPLVIAGAWREVAGPAADRRRGTLLLAWLAGPVLVPFAFSHLAFPVYVARGAIVAGGAFLLLAAFGLDALRDRRPWFLAGLGAAALALAFGVHRQVTRVDREDWRGVANELSARTRPDDLVLVGDERERLAVRIYAPGLDVAWGFPGDVGGDTGAGRSRVWLVRSEHARWPAEAIDRWRAAGWRPLDARRFPRLVLERWER